MKNIYFIANNHNVNLNIFSDYKKDIYNGDVLHFNTMYYFDLFKDHPKNIIYHNINASDKGVSWWGVDQVKYYMQFYIKDRYLYYNEYIPFHNPECNPVIDNWKKDGGKLLLHSKEDIGNYVPPTQCSSAGFMCYKYFKDLYDMIYLIGFTFEGSKRHNWEYEKSVMMEDHKVKELTE
jgi:hypothetical protein